MLGRIAGALRGWDTEPEFSRRFHVCSLGNKGTFAVITKKHILCDCFNIQNE